MHEEIATVGADEVPATAERSPRARDPVPITPRRFLAILAIAFVSPVLSALVFHALAAIYAGATDGTLPLPTVLMFTTTVGVLIGWIVIPFVALFLEALRSHIALYYLAAVPASMVSLVVPPVMIVAIPFALLTAWFVVLQICHVYRLRCNPPPSAA